MAVGLQDRKIGFVIQARMQSNRFPGKILMPLPFPNGKPLLSWIVHSLKLSKFYSKIYIATSTHTSNDLLLNFCRSEQVDLFRGDESDVLSRFIAIAESEDFDYIVRLTSDNPFLDVDLLDQFIEHFLSSSYDYEISKGLPVGMNFEVMKVESLISLTSFPLTDYHREHVTLFFRDNSNFSTSSYDFDFPDYVSNLRLSVDYPVDFLVASTLFSLLPAHSKSISIQFIINCYEKYPWIFLINMHLVQKKKFSSILEEVTFLETFFKDNDLYFLQEFIKGFKSE